MENQIGIMDTYGNFFAAYETPGPFPRNGYVRATYNNITASVPVTIYGELWIWDGSLLNTVVRSENTHDGLDFMLNTAIGQSGNYAKASNGYFFYEAYAAHGGWAFVAIYIKPASGPKGYVNLSQYSRVTYRLKSNSTVANGVVKVAAKDDTDADGSETTISINGLSTSWKSYTNTVSSFTTLDPTRVFLLLEFVIGTDAVSLFIDDVKYLQ
ncbi:MAG: hypothetical protein PHF84_06380 [bacterium]|nr:hypothetical protein [bacterium]